MKHQLPATSYVPEVFRRRWGCEITIKCFYLVVSISSPMGAISPMGANIRMITVGVDHERYMGVRI